MRQLIGTNIDHRDGGDVQALPTGMPVGGRDEAAVRAELKHDVIMLVGVDPSEEIPVLDVHLKRAVRRRRSL